MAPENTNVTLAHDLLHRMDLIFRVQGETALVYGDTLKTKTHAIGIVTTVYRPELDSRHTAENY